MGRKDDRIKKLERSRDDWIGQYERVCAGRDEARAEVERLNRYADAATARADMAEAEASHWVHLLEGANGAVERVRAERDKAWDDLARYSKLPPLADGEEYASVGWWRGLDDAERERWEWRSVDGCGPWWTNQSGADDCEHIVVRERVPAAADAIRAALADGSLTPEDLGMELHDECTLSACEGTADPHHPLYRLPSKEVTDG